MAEPGFCVVCYGQRRPGHSLDQVRLNLANNLNISDKKIDNLLSGNKVFIKRDLSFAAANSYKKSFYLWGLLVEVESSATQQTSNFMIDDFERKTLADEANALMLNRDQEKPSEPVPPKPANPETTPDDSEFPKVLNFEFTGSGGEYFKIWVVNILLTILTLGIYSAWAKVRNKQYFYGNSILDGASFEYTAKPIQILKGRILAVILIGIYYFLSMQLAPSGEVALTLIVTVFLIVVLPWVIVQSLRFNARYSRYRNIAFGFDGTYGGAFKAFILWPIVSFTIVLLPFVWHRKTKYFVENSRYGGERFEFTAGTGDYYRILGMLVVVAIGCGVAGGFGFMMGGFLMEVNFLLGASIMALAYIAIYLFTFAYWQVSSNNVKYNNSEILSHTLSGNYELKSYVFMLIKNTLCVLSIVGIPWALIRTARYHAEHTQFIAAEPLDKGVKVQQEQVGSFAEGLADAHDVFSVDVGI